MKVWLVVGIALVLAGCGKSEMEKSFEEGQQRARNQCFKMEGCDKPSNDQKDTPPSTKPEKDKDH